MPEKNLYPGARQRPTRRTLLFGAGLAAAGSLLVKPTTAEATPPPTPRFGPQIDPYAALVGQSVCDPTAKPGVLGFRDIMQAAYGSRNLGITRACDIGGRSEHKEGRAWDMAFNANTEAGLANELLGWLLATDQYGNAHALARRFGIMYIIWNRRIWASYTRVWNTYNGSNPHTDHIHFSFSWDGAWQRTTWWTGSRRPIDRDYSGDGFGDLVTVSPDGYLDYYRNNASSNPGGVPFTHVSHRSPGPTWGGVPAISGGDISGDGSADLMVVSADGYLDYYPNNASSNPGSNPFAGASHRSPGPTWGGTKFLGVGDISGDGSADLMAVAGDGYLYYYPNNAGTNPGNNPFSSAQYRSPAPTWGGVTAFTVGDLNGDGFADILVVGDDGYLYGYYNNGRASQGEDPFHGAAWRSVEPSWGGVQSISATDISGDGSADLLMIDSDNYLYYYPNNAATNPGGRPFASSQWRSETPTWGGAKLA